MREGRESAKKTMERPKPRSKGKRTGAWLETRLAVEGQSPALENRLKDRYEGSKKGRKNFG